jgi:Tol biopolymer transport system component
MKKKRFLSWLGIILAVQFCFSCSSPAPEEPEVVPLDGRGGGVIAYCRGQIGSESSAIRGINGDGSGDALMCQASIALNHHDWSPDGSRFALVGYFGQATWSIHVIRADGGGLTRLTAVENVQDSEPAWSADGSRIAFTRIYPDQNYRNEIWIMNADGSDAHWIGVVGFAAEWSGDGTRLLYIYDDQGIYDQSGPQNGDVYTCSSDGSNVRRLTASGARDRAQYPSWSPDGSRIVFATNRDGNYEIYVMNADGTQPLRLTVTSASENSPAWSPDGSLIAFCSSLSGAPADTEIFGMSADGSNRRQLTSAVGNDYAINPDWKPVGH